MPRKAYFEITNACNLKCSFCHGTKREIKFITKEQFLLGASRLRGFADFLYFHLLGEPLLHPMLGDFLCIAKDMGFKPIITTNGTLLGKAGETILACDALHKISISLHCWEANQMGIPYEEYLESCFDFCEKASEKGIISVMRLWNKGGKDSLNADILERMEQRFGTSWKETYSGYKLKEKIFLEWGEKFEWPDMGNSEMPVRTCYGIRDQIGVLCDGTVVPCCLDADGVVPLGNIYETDLTDILSTPRAKRIKESFEKGAPCESLCRRCGFATRFTK